MQKTFSRSWARYGALSGSTAVLLAGTLVGTSAYALAATPGTPAGSAVRAHRPAQLVKPHVKPRRPAVVKAVRLKVPDGLRRRLGDLYYATRDEPDIRRRDVVGPIDLYFGKVERRTKPRTIFYAIGNTGVFNELINPRDLPHVWRKEGKDGKWEYVGTTPQGLCGPVPRRLARAWKVGCS